MKISQLKKKYKNQWILAEVIKEDELNRVTDVKPLAHSTNRNEIYEKLTKQKGKHVMTLYTGETPPKGMVYSF